MMIELLVGMIGSGKSTYARRRGDEGALVVCHDDLTAMLHARYRYEPGLRDVYRQMEDALVERAAVWGRDAVIDRTHLSRESRQRWLAVAALLRVPIVAVAFPVLDPEIHARRRFAADSRGRSLEDWLRVARHHAEQAEAEPLSADEGFDRIVIVPDQPHIISTERRAEVISIPVEEGE